jgi:hypothetical protein
MEFIIFLSGVIIGAVVALICVALAMRSEKGMIGRGYGHH